MSVDDDFEDLVGLLYEAALEPERWPLVLTRIAGLVGADSGLLGIGSTRRPDEGMAVPFTLNVDPVHQRQWVESHLGGDAWWLAFSERFEEGVLTGAQCVDVEALHRTPLYNEVLVHAGVEDGLFAGIARTPRADAIAAFYRGPERDRFASGDVARLSRLLPHLRRASEIHDRMQALASTRDANDALVDRLPYGLIWLDDTGRVLAMNAAADRLLARDDGLRAKNSRLEARIPANRDELERAIADAIAVATGRSMGAGGLVRIQRISRRPPYPLLAVPIPRRSGEILFSSQTGPPVVALLITDPDAPIDLDAHTMRELFKLTPALARLAAAIAGGLTLAEYAAQAGVTIGTVRQQMKELLARMGARRQADAVRMILTSVVQLRRSDGSSG